MPKTLSKPAREVWGLSHRFLFGRLSSEIKRTVEIRELVSISARCLRFSGLFGEYGRAIRRISLWTRSVYLFRDCILEWVKFIIRLHKLISSYTPIIPCALLVKKDSVYPGPLTLALGSEDLGSFCPTYKRNLPFMRGSGTSDLDRTTAMEFERPASEGPRCQTA
jgi:hypothetical protein